MTYVDILAWAIAAVSPSPLPTPPPPGPPVPNGTLIAWAAVVLGPVSAAIGYMLSSHNSKRSLAVTSQSAKDTAEVAGRNAATQEFAVIMQGWQATFERMDRERKDDRLEIEHLGEDVAVLVEHIVQLEQLIPSPPGAPQRPKLKTYHHR